MMLNIDVLYLSTRPGFRSASPVITSVQKTIICLVFEMFTKIIKNPKCLQILRSMDHEGGSRVFVNHRFSSEMNPYVSSGDCPRPKAGFSIDKTITAI